MILSTLFLPTVLFGAVFVSLAGAPRTFGQVVSKPRAATATVRPTIATALPVTRDTTTGTTTAATDPVGFTSLSLPANSDSRVSIPFTRPAVFSGAIGSVSSNTITVASSPNWTANQYVYASSTQSNTYYAIIGPMLTTISGTVTVTSGSTAVTATAGFAKIVAGDELIVNGLAYNVASVSSDTSLTLSRAFTGMTASGQTASYDHSPKEGSYYTVTANGTNSLTVNLNGDSLSTVVAGTTVTLIPYWTLGTAFPASDAGTSYIASSGATTFTRQTQILLPDMTTAGFDLAASAIYYYYNGAWRLSGGDPTVSANDTTLPLTNYFTVRNAGTATTFTPTGGVYMNRIAAPLDTQPSTAQDNASALPRPVSTSLNDLGLITSGAFKASSGATSFTRADSLLAYDNTQTGTDKSASAIYYFYNNAWRLSGGDPTVDVGSTTLPYGTGFIIRKAPAANGATSFWQNTRTY